MKESLLFPLCLQGVGSKSRRQLEEFIEDLRKKLSVKYYKENDFIRTVYPSLQDYLDNTNAKPINCFTCGKTTKYVSAYSRQSRDKNGADCYDCNVKRRMENY